MTDQREELANAIAAFFGENDSPYDAADACLPIVAAGVAEERARCLAWLNSDPYGLVHVIANRFAGIESGAWPEGPTDA